MTNQELAIIVKVIDKATAPFRNIQNNVDKMTKAFSGVSNGFGKAIENARNLGDVVSRVKDIMVGLGTAFKTEFVDTAAKFESFGAVLETVEGSAIKAKKSMGWVSDFAAKTPYEIDQVMESFVRLKSYGLDPTKGLLSSLGDTSSAMGKPLMQAVEMMSDAITGENERLKEFGIRGSKEGNQIIYEYTSKAGETMRKAVDASNRAMIQSTLMTIFNEKYKGAMDKQSKTWGGMMSNVSDQWTRFKLMMMEAGPFDFLKGKLQSTLDYVNKLTKTGELQEWANKIADKIIKVFKTLYEWGLRGWNVFQQIWKFSDNFVKSLGGWERFLGIVGSVAVIVGTIAGGIAIIGGAASIIVPIIEGVIALWPAIVAIGGVLSSILPYFPVIGGVFLLLKEFFSRGKFSINDLFKIDKATMKTFEGIKKNALSIFKDVSKAFDNFIRGFIFGFFDIADAGNGIRDILANAWPQIQQKASPLIDTIKKIGKTLLGLDWKTIGEVAGWALGLIAQGLVFISSESARVVVDGIAGIISGLWKIAEGVAWVVGKIGEAFGWVVGYLPTLINRAGELFFFMDKKAFEVAKVLVDMWNKPGEALKTALKFWGDLFLKFANDVFDRGVSIGESLAKGMTKSMPGVVTAITNVMGAIDRFLPHSPAREGPLKNLHKVRIVETIAETMKPKVITNAMNSSLIPIRQNYGGGGGGVTIHYAPVITMGSGGGGSSIEDLKKLLKEQQYELYRIFQREQAKLERTRY